MSEPYYCWAIRNKEGYFLSSKYTEFYQFHCNTFFSDKQDCLERIKKSGLNAGVAINPETSLKSLKPYKEILDHVLIMGYPAGFAGQKLNPIVFDRLAEVREMFPSVEVGLDGGVSPSNAKKVLQAGFDVVNINTLIFGNADPLSAYSELLGYSI